MACSGTSVGSVETGFSRTTSLLDVVYGSCGLSGPE